MEYCRQENKLLIHWHQVFPIILSFHSSKSIYLQYFISRKWFEFFTTLSIYLQDPGWPFFHLTDDLEGNGISSEGFLKWGKV